MNDKLIIPLSIVIAGVLIGGGIYLNGRMTSDNSTPAERRQADSKNLSGALRPIDDNDHIIGSPNARIIIVEYSDTECAFCKIFHQSLLSIMQEYGGDGKVAWVYRHFPIAEIHSKSLKQAEALECAAVLGGNGTFWEYTNNLYEVTPSNNGLEDSELPKIASRVGLPVDKFNICLESGEFGPRVASDIQNAEELGALGTPYSVLIDTKSGEHYPIEGAYPYAELKQVIDLILNQ